MPPTGRDRERLLERVHQLRWSHVIDLGGGVSTPGSWVGHGAWISEALDTIDFRGKKVLDIGCWDGLWSFEAEKRGAAQVYGTDLVDQRNFSEDSTFLLAREILGSRAEYRPDLSVYDVERLGVDDFDVVTYPGVYYHLKDPLLSFARLRRVMKEGAVLLVEGAVIDSEDCYARFYYREPYLRDHSNWWVPTTGCLREWVECSFFAIEEEFGVLDAGGGNLRSTLTARAVRRADPLYIRPAEGLAEFDANVYPRQFGDPVPEALDPTPARHLTPQGPSPAIPGPPSSRLSTSRVHHEERA